MIDPNGNIVYKTSCEGFRDEVDNVIKREIEMAKIIGTLAKEKIKIRYKRKKKRLLSYPTKLGIDKVNNRLFISDSNNNRILVVRLDSKITGKVIEIIGNGEKGLNDGYYNEASFYKPQGIIYYNNSLYVCDTGNHALRKIDLIKKTVTTILWNGKNEHQFNSPCDGVIQDNFLYITMAGSHQLWRMDINTYQLELFAGSGKENILDGHVLEAQLAQPSSITSDGSKLYFCDSETSSIRFVDLNNDTVGTLIGKGLFKFGHKDGSFRVALLQHPMGLCYHDNNIYICDTYNHAIRVANLEKNRIKTIISRPMKGVCNLEGKECNILPLNEPNDILYNEGLLYIADTNNHVIRVFDIEQDIIKDLIIE